MLFALIVALGSRNQSLEVQSRRTDKIDKTGSTQPCRLCATTLHFRTAPPDVAPAEALGDGMRDGAVVVNYHILVISSGSTLEQLSRRHAN